MSNPKEIGSVLIVDDEPEYLLWLKEYLEANNLSCDFALNLSDALKTLATKAYAFVLIDMNIPSAGANSDILSRTGPLADRYPGLAVVSRCRNTGYRGYQVIAYTVHDDPSLGAEIEDRLMSTYILKSRPQVLKKMIQSNISGLAKRIS